MAQRPIPFIGAVRTPWLRPVAQGGRVLGVVVGGVTAGVRGATALDAAVALLLLAFIAWRAAPRSLELARIRDVVAFELLLTGGAVAVTGGWSSPWLASLVVALGLAALGLTLARAGALAAVATVLTSLATVGRPVSGSEVLTRLSSMLVVVLFGAVTRKAMLDAGGPVDESLGRLETLWNVRGLLEGLHSSVARTPARFSVEEAVRTLRRSSPVLAGADVLAVVAADEETGRLRLVGGADAHVDRDLDEALPSRVRTPSRDGSIVVLPLGDEGFVRSSDHGVYLWLPVERSAAPHLVAVEVADTEVLVDDVTPELRRLAQPLAVTVANAAWFDRVRTLSVDEERQRIAARLHDQFAQSLAVVSMELDLAVRRHPGDDELGTLRRHVRESLGELRDTMVELRATVDEERPLGEVLRSLLGRVERRHGITGEVTVDGDGPRPPLAVEQQLLRVAQELVRRAVEDRHAGVVRVVHTHGTALALLEVQDDGSPPAEQLRLGIGDVIGDRVEAVGGTTTTRRTDGGLGAVRVTVPVVAARDDHGTVV